MHQEGNSSCSYCGTRRATLTNIRTLYQYDTNHCAMMNFRYMYCLIVSIVLGKRIQVPGTMYGNLEVATVATDWLMRDTRYFVTFVN